MELIKENKPSLKKRYKIIPMVLFILGIILTCISMDILYTFKEKEQDILLTGYLVDEFQSNHIPINFSTVYVIVKHGKSIMHKWFPDNTFGLMDLLAIGYVESCYNPDTVGTSGEVGLFQILRPGESLKRLKLNKEYDFYDIPLNIEMCAEMLKQKYDSNGKKDYQLTIIAYNGSSTYWPKFIRIKKIVDKARLRLHKDLTL